MIEPLKLYQHKDLAIASKINELVEAYNTIDKEMDLILNRLEPRINKIYDSLLPEEPKELGAIVVCTKNKTYNLFSDGRWEEAKENGIKEEPKVTVEEALRREYKPKQERLADVIERVDCSNCHSQSPSEMISNAVIDYQISKLPKEKRQQADSGTVFMDNYGYNSALTEVKKLLEGMR